MPVYNCFSVNNLRFLHFHGMEEVIGSISIRQSASKMADEISQQAQNSQDARQLEQCHPTGTGLAFASLRRTSNFTKGGDTRDTVFCGLGSSDPSQSRFARLQTSGSC
jgi:hypothetical protein